MSEKGASNKLAVKKKGNGLSFVTKAIEPRKLETKVIKYIDDNTRDIVKTSMAHIALPFFTNRKKNRNVHLEYDIGFMGLTMSSHINTDPNKNISQPGETEEILYDFLIAKMNDMINDYKKLHPNEDIDYSSFLENNRIEFDYKEFGEAVGLTVTSSINTRLDRAFENMKYTTYTFNKKNKAKSDKKILEFEEDVFSLINYKKLTIGRKKYYSVMLKNPVLVDAYEKKLFLNYTNSDSKIMGANNKITDKVYKIISMSRFNKDVDEMSIMQLACSVPYELTTKSVSKGKTYLKCMKSNVIKKLMKNFDDLVKLKYLKWYEVINDESFKYEFLDVKLPLVTTHNLTKHLEYKKAEEKKLGVKTFKKKVVSSKNIEQAEVTHSSPTTVAMVEDGSAVDKAIKKAKRNIFVSKAWNKRVDNKIKKLLIENGEEYTTFILKAIYDNLKQEITTTLVQYINGVMKKIPNENFDKPLKKAIKVPKDNLIIEAEIVEKEKEVKPEVDEMAEMIYVMYLDMKKERQEIIMKKAVEKFMKDSDSTTFVGVQKQIFKSVEKTYIARIIKEELEGIK